MTDLRDTDRTQRTVDHRYEDPEPLNMREIDRRMRFWEMANGALCVLFLWAPIAAAAFHRVG